MKTTVPPEILSLPTTARNVIAGRAPIETHVSAVPCQLIQSHEVSTGGELMYLGMAYIAQELELTHEMAVSMVSGPTVIYGDPEKKSIKACKYVMDGEQWLFICMVPEHGMPYNATIN